MRTGATQRPHLEHSRTDRLLDLGVHNTLAEIAEAQNTSQIARLSTMRSGRHILQKVNIRPRNQTAEGTTTLSEPMLRLPRVRPLPNTNPEPHPERRLARARSLASTYAAYNTAYYVDAAEDRARPNYYTAVATAASDGTIRAAGSFKAMDSHHAEELAIALAATDPRCRTIFSDSRTAILRFANNTTSTSTARFLHRTGQTRQHPIFISWYPAHVGPLDPEGRIRNRNEEADRAARGLTYRATHTSQHSDRNRNS
ncbi:hypothetical protein HPB48_012921 [Haemaphysalis longicornis]|uniref:Tick transposon n=1 Tax=Haemaphysalis longicornis TaxID=44386 RepID=A0A9J6FR17_HAELO|nr:hypothetical protein HPB48_012921 [Haemaphysalis longicornis]